MLVYIDGPEKVGKTTLSKAVLENFAPSRSHYVKNNGADKGDGLGYLEMLVKSIQSDDIFVWDRGWVSEFVYGSLLAEDRWLANNPFLTEWLYGRPMVDRGGRFMVNPIPVRKSIDKRDDTDLDVDPIRETYLFLNHAETYDYNILRNEYNDDSLNKNVEKVLKATKRKHKYGIEDYVGPEDPEAIFVDQCDWVSGVKMPMLDFDLANFFRPFGSRAIKRFAYVTIEQFDVLPKAMQAKGICVSANAQYWFPNTESVKSIRLLPTRENIDTFTRQVSRIIGG